MATARVLRLGNRQALQLPKGFSLKGDEVEVFRRGDEIILLEKSSTMAKAFIYSQNYSLILT
jgi:antitoxin VapB